MATHEGVDEFTQSEVAGLGVLEDVVEKGFIAEAAEAPEAVFEKGGGEAACEGFGLGGDVIAQGEVVGEGWPFVEHTGGIDFPGFLGVWDGFALVVEDLKSVLGAPETCGVEVFETEADGIDFTVAAGALGELLVRLRTLAGGEEFACETGKLRDVGGRRRRRGGTRDSGTTRLEGIGGRS